MVSLSKNKLFWLAVIAMFIGVLCICGVIVVYILFDEHLKTASQTNLSVRGIVQAFRWVVFGICPGICVVVIGLSIEVISFLKNGISNADQSMHDANGN
jgi:hypothetical protein